LALSLQQKSPDSWIESDDQPHSSSTNQACQELPSVLKRSQTKERLMGLMNWVNVGRSREPKIWNNEVTVDDLRDKADSLQAIEDTNDL
jgi:hypothetical protein